MNLISACSAAAASRASASRANSAAPEERSSAYVVERLLYPLGQECHAEPGVEQARYGWQPLQLGRLGPPGSLCSQSSLICLIRDPEPEWVNDPSPFQCLVLKVEGLTGKDGDCVGVR